MRLFALSALVMTAFAANSLLNRAALGAGLIEALPFALIRVASGALVLILLARTFGPRGAPFRAGRAHLLPALWLTLYLVGFSVAYLALDAGIGALVLFATVQVTMLAGATLAGDRPSPRRLAGAALALAGLAALLLPGSDAIPSVWAALTMGAAGLGWGLYSLAGRTARDPLGATAGNFILATPLVALACLPAGLGNVTAGGVGLALLSGAVTSGLGYALWYRILPELGAARAAVAQLTVPVIAIAAGALLLAETLSPGAIAASVLVLAGVALAILPPRQR